MQERIHNSILCRDLSDHIYGISIASCLSVSEFSACKSLRLVNEFGEKKTKEKYFSFHSVHKLIKTNTGNQSSYCVAYALSFLLVEHDHTNMH